MLIQYVYNYFYDCCTDLEQLVILLLFCCINQTLLSQRNKV